MSVTQNEKAARFQALHDSVDGFVIPNPWDFGSARILAGLGFHALATSRAASASARGRRDHGPTRDEALAHAPLIVVRQVVHEHGGEIWLEDPPSWGACFAFSLPVS